MAYIKRPYRGSITVDVEVDINDVLADIDDDGLREELKARGQAVESFSKKQTDALSDMFDELRLAISARDLAEALAIIDAFERPKWSTADACQAEYLKVKSPSTPNREDAGT